MKCGINSTRCSDDSKIALGCASCNFIAILATTREIYPKFHGAIIHNVCGQKIKNHTLAIDSLLHGRTSHQII